MLKPDSLDGLVPAEAPRDGAVVFPLSFGRILIVSYDAYGDVYEEMRTLIWRKNDTISLMLDRMRADPGRLRIVK